MRRERWILKLAALLLQYPGPGFDATLAAVDKELEGAALSRNGGRRTALPTGGVASQPGAAGALAAAVADLQTFCREARGLAPVEWERRYVDAFDFQKDRALYLTFHDWGESMERAGALVALKEQIERAGFVCPDAELPDFVPLLLEFLAEKPPTYPDGNLPGRLAPVLEKITASLAAADPLYVPVCRAAQAALASLAARQAARASKASTQLVTERNLNAGC